MKVFSVYDAKGSFFDKPFVARNAGEACRGFDMTVNDPKNDSMIKRFPADYTLFEIGEWDEQQGQFIAHQAKVNLGTGLKYVKDQPKL